jgi:uncharacterized membrane protein YccC
MIIECSVTAGLAWFLAGQLIHHEVPYFAPVAAILVLGVTSGQRLSRGVEMAIGVTVGVALGDLWLILFGTGTWQIMLIVAIATSLATLLGAGPLIMSQAGVQSIAVTVLAPNFGYGFNRWIDAVIGCVLALLVATVAPSGPLRRPTEAAAKVVSGMAETLDAAADALATNDEHAASAVLDRAEAAEKDLAVFDAASNSSATPCFNAAGCQLQLHWPTSTYRLTVRAATFGYWLGDLLSPCGGGRRCRWLMKISSESLRKRADLLLGSWRSAGFQPPRGMNSARLARPRHISISPNPSQPT